MTDQQATIDHLRAETERMDERIAKLENETDVLRAATSDLRAENEQLHERLAALEARVGIDPTPADD